MITDNELTPDITLFLSKVVDFAELEDGEQGLLKMRTEKGQREYMARFLEANKKTVEKVLSLQSSVRRELQAGLGRKLYHRFTSN